MMTLSIRADKNNFFSEVFAFEKADIGNIGSTK
jgi:hypothetical protein